MAIKVICSKCSTPADVPDAAAGCSGKCSACGEIVHIPGGIKRCISCGTDVSNQKRTKDREGKYYCEPCWAAKVSSTQQTLNISTHTCSVCNGSFDASAVYDDQGQCICKECYAIGSLTDADLARRFRALAIRTLRQVQRTSLTHIALPRAFKMLGQHVHATGQYRQEFREIYGRIDQRLSRVRAISDHASSRPQSERFTAKAKAAVVKVKEIAVTKAMETLVNKDLSRLGKVAFDSHGGESGPSDLIDAIRQCKSRIEAHRVEIGRLWRSKSNQFLKSRATPVAGAATKPRVIADEMKECPYCAERIQPKATKCRYCGESLIDDGTIPLSTPPLRISPRSVSSPADSLASLTSAYSGQSTSQSPTPTLQPENSRRRHVAVLCGVVVVIVVASIAAIIVSQVFDSAYSTVVGGASNKAAGHSSDNSNISVPTISDTSFVDFDSKFCVHSRLTDLQKDQRIEHLKGERVRWEGIVNYVSEDSVGFQHKATTQTYDVLLTVTEGERSSLVRLNMGDLATYEGTIDSYGEVLPHGLKEGRIISHKEISPGDRLIFLAHTETAVLNRILGKSDKPEHSDEAHNDP